MTTEATAPADTGNTPATAATAATTDSTTAQVAATETSTATTALTAPDTTTEGKTATTEAPAEGVKPEAAAPKAPEKYEFKAQEGQTLAPEVMNKFSEVAKEMDLSQEQAQKLVDTVAPQMLQAQQAMHAKQVAEWTDAAKADKEFGGDKLNENLAVAKKALEAFGSPELTDLLNSTGLGNNPAVIRAFVNIGKQISSASFVPGGRAPVSQSSTAASKLYPDQA